MSASRPPSTTASALAEARRSLLARKASLSVDTEASRAELLELDAALGRIEAGTWGRCEHCGGAIGRTRLRALPDARLCLPCSRS